MFCSSVLIRVRYLVVAVIGDWDADGVVSTAEIVYSQGVLGVFPVRGTRDVFAVPTSVRHVDGAVKEILDRGANYVVFLDIAYSRYMDRALSLLKSRGVGVLYIDHHISTAIHMDSIRPCVDVVVVGRTSTAMLVYNMLRSRGVDVSDRLKAFIEAVTIIEKGSLRGLKPVDRKLVDIVASMSRALTKAKDRDLWFRVVKWLTEPLPLAALPFTSPITLFVNESRNRMEELKTAAMEIAMGCTKIFSVRFADIRGRRYPFKPTAIASALHRILKSPVALLAKSNSGDDILIMKSSDTTAYDIALHLYKKGLVEDVMGHQTLTIMLVKIGVGREQIEQAIREFMISGPAGI